MGEMDATEKTCTSCEKRNHLEFLLKRPSEEVDYPPKPNYKKLDENHTQTTQQDRKVQNQQLKVNWQFWLKKIEEIGCGDKPWEKSDQKTTSLLCLCIRTKGHRISEIKHPPFIIETESTQNLRKAMEHSFIKACNITYYRFVFLVTKQHKRDLVESFYGRLIHRA